MDDERLTQGGIETSENCCNVWQYSRKTWPWVYRGTEFEGGYLCSCRVSCQYRGGEILGATDGGVCERDREEDLRRDLRHQRRDG